jgi:hypothetical protein
MARAAPLCVPAYPHRPATYSAAGHSYVELLQREIGSCSRAAHRLAVSVRAVQTLAPNPDVVMEPQINSAVHCMDIDVAERR